MKRSRHLSTSDDSDNGSSSTCWSHSSQHRRGSGQKPSEVFRTDLITAMKLHDSHPLNPEDYFVLADPWRQEWEKGVQVPVSPQSIPQPVTRYTTHPLMFIRPKKLIRTSGTEALGYVDIRTLADGVCRYDLNEEDVAWLQIVNEEFAEMGLPLLDENTMERAMEEFERRCYENMTHAMETEEGLGIEYDEDVVCDVCQSPDGEDNNEMVFCDKCNICVHQACYGIQKVPQGSWLCRICALGILPKCQLCPKKGGGHEPRPPSCIGNPEKMEPITNVSHIPSNRWALICCLCKEKAGACIQCSAKNCRTAFHVTCGLQANLEMNTILTEDDEVKFKSFCPKHSGHQGAEPRDQESEDDEDGEEAVGHKKGRKGGVTRGGDASSYPLPSYDQEGLSLQEKRVSLRKLKLQEMEEDFYRFVEVEEVACSLKLPPEVLDFLYQYWKLKRKANFNQPLLTPKKDEEESLARREQEVLLRRLQLFTHLRQDLERVRNLTYMVTRREKIKRSLWKVQEQILQQQVVLLDQELLNGESCLQTRRPLVVNVSRFPLKQEAELRSKALKAAGRGRPRPLNRRNEFFIDEGVAKRGPAFSDVTPNSKVSRASGVLDAATLPKANVWLRRTPIDGAHAPPGATAGHLRSWGKFRIPRRGERPPAVAWKEAAEPHKPLLRPLTNTPEPSYPRTRLRTGAEHDGYPPDPKGGHAELEPCLKRCHSHELRGDASLGRRYGSDIIRRGVLAS
uniref:Protein Jade-1 n=1 Tax=Oryzias sinensis TaxID=183150 RepID=A0A8C7X335_9TELE